MKLSTSQLKRLIHEAITTKYKSMKEFDNALAKVAKEYGMEMKQARKIKTLLGHERSDVYVSGLQMARSLSIPDSLIFSAYPPPEGVKK